MTDKYEAIRQKARTQLAAMQKAYGEVEKTMGTPKVSRRTDSGTQSAPAIAVENTKAFQILADASLTPEQKIEKLAALLTFDENELDLMLQFMNEDRALVAKLLSDFTERNRQSIELVRDNPLSKLRGGIADVFADYHKLTSGRTDLKDKLKLVDELMAKYGGPKELVEAMLAAKDKEAEYLSKKAASEKAKQDAFVASDKVDRSRRRLSLAQKEIAENSGDLLLIFKPKKSHRLANARSELAKTQEAIVQEEQVLTQKVSEAETLAKALADFMTAADWQVNEKILSILNIGGPEFIQRVKDLSNVTLSYIDKTEDVLTGARDQLEALLRRTIMIHALTHNTKESVAIMLEAHKQAQGANASKLREMEKVENLEGIDKLEHDKKKRALHQHISALDKQAQSTTAVAAELGKIESSLTNFKDQMEEGLADATEQQMLAVSSAAVTGNNTLMRIEGLATFVQSVVSRGQYYKESEEALGELAKEMERALMGRLAKNENIKDVTDVLGEMTSALENKNDVILEIAEHRRELIDRLLKQADELGKANERALAVDAEVNKKLYAEE